MSLSLAADTANERNYNNMLVLQVYASMPYFVFELHPPARTRSVAEFDDYRSAKQDVTKRRKRIADGEAYTVRMVHAADRRQAQRLLTEKREPRPLGEDG